MLHWANPFCRRERDHSEAERAQHIQQIHDLQEHIQEKDRQLIELQEQVGRLYIYISIMLGAKELNSKKNYFIEILKNACEGQEGGSPSQ